MLLPYKSANPPESLPIGTIALIAINTIIFAFTQDGLVIKESVLDMGGMAPNNVSIGRFFSSLFLHGDILHLLGNMWFLYLFGFAVEGRLKTLKFLLLYLIAGAAGDGLHLLLFGAAEPDIPSIGASGAIMGCLGAAVYMFPHSQVRFFYWFGWFWRGLATWSMIWVAVWYIGWDVLGAIMDGAAGGVGHLAHIGGAIGGALMCLVFRAKRDSEYVSQAKATFSDTKDLSILSPSELAEMYRANPADTTILLNWVDKDLRSARPSDAAANAMMEKFDAVLSSQPVRPVGSILLSLAIAGRQIPPVRMIQTAMKVEQDGDAMLAFKLYEATLKLNPGPEDQQAAVYRGAVLCENHMFNYPRAAHAYQWLIQTFPMGTFTEQAKLRLEALKRSGKV